MSHIVTAESAEKRIRVSWFLLDRESARLMWSIEQPESKRSRTLWCALVAFLKSPHGDFYGVAWTSKRDTFNLSLGMSIAYARVVGKYITDPEMKSAIDGVVASNLAASELLERHTKRFSANTGHPLASPGERRTREIALHLIGRGETLLRAMEGPIDHEGSRQGRQRKHRAISSPKTQIVKSHGVQVAQKSNGFLIRFTSPRSGQDESLGLPDASGMLHPLGSYGELISARTPSRF